MGPGVKFMLVLCVLGPGETMQATSTMHVPNHTNRLWQSLQKKMQKKKKRQSLNHWRLGGWVGVG